MLRLPACPKPPPPPPDSGQIALRVFLLHFIRKILAYNSLHFLCRFFANIHTQFNWGFPCYFIFVLLLLGLLRLNYSTRKAANKTCGRSPNSQAGRCTKWPVIMLTVWAGHEGRCKKKAAKAGEQRKRGKNEAGVEKARVLWLVSCWMELIICVSCTQTRTHTHRHTHKQTHTQAYLPQPAPSRDAAQ